MWQHLSRRQWLGGFLGGLGMSLFGAGRAKTHPSQAVRRERPLAKDECPACRLRRSPSSSVLTYDTSRPLPSLSSAPLCTKTSYDLGEPLSPSPFVRSTVYTWEASQCPDPPGEIVTYEYRGTCPHCGGPCYVQVSRRQGYVRPWA
jgi:hypothetical protein